MLIGALVQEGDHGSKLISEQQVNYSETGGHVLTPFFDMCQER